MTDAIAATGASAYMRPALSINEVANPSQDTVQTDQTTPTTPLENSAATTVAASSASSEQGGAQSESQQPPASERGPNLDVYA
nr:hypothetical protein [Oceanococcus sp. HetDA_MAG_MS8]